MTRAVEKYTRSNIWDLIRQDPEFRELFECRTAYELSQQYEMMTSIVKTETSSSSSQGIIRASEVLAATAMSKLNSVEPESENASVSGRTRLARS